MNTISSNMNKRYVWLDILKICATFFVVLQHSISHVWTNFAIDSFTWKVTHIFFLFSRTAVPLFFMCSGAGMLQKEHTIKKIFKKNIFYVLKIYMTWMLIYGLFDCISLFKEGLATPRTCINAIIKCFIFGEYHTWFLLALVSLYLITPFLHQITKNIIHMQYFLIISIIFTVIIPFMNSFDFLTRLSDTFNNFHMHFVYGYVLYYVCGYYISNLSWKKSYNYIAFLILILSFGFACIYSLNQSIVKNSPSQEIFNEFSPFMFLSVISIFCIFKGLNLNFIPSHIVSNLSHYGFAIYLMHPLFLSYINQLNGLFAFGGTILLYILCLIICSVISKNQLLSKLLLH